MLVSIEGIDNAGKTTLAENLKHLYTGRGKRCVVFHGPDLKNTTGAALETMMERFSEESVPSDDDKRILHLLFVANRLEMQEKVREEFAKGSIVLFDRYIISGLTYELMDGTITPEMHRGTIIPDLTVYLSISPEKAQERAGFGEGFREKKDYHERSATTFREVMESMKLARLSDTFAHIVHPIEEIDASMPEDDVVAAAAALIERYTPSE